MGRKEHVESLTDKKWVRQTFFSKLTVKILRQRSNVFIETSDHNYIMSFVIRVMGYSQFPIVNAEHILLLVGYFEKQSLAFKLK